MHRIELNTKWIVQHTDEKSYFVKSSNDIWEIHEHGRMSRLTEHFVDKDANSGVFVILRDDSNYYYKLTEIEVLEGISPDSITNVMAYGYWRIPSDSTS